ncbi:NnrS family protein [Motiliproteus sp. SC1-56]|uniref:NnrS family protein n=1 Tax=Motiliproteus sp. SC1-56 TaxID=2799565 RepID=UPI001A8E8B9A|nr:NnrS family protein [Motiliproteus sp. SC1-56]
MNIERPEDRIPPDRFALFYLGFRPFFGLGALAAVVLILLWLPYYHGHLSLNGYFTPVAWHAHEMLYGYALAIIAGFLLTAVRNWTGEKVPSGWPLVGLVAVWLAGRLLCTLDLGQPGWLTALVDIAFAPLVILALARPLLAARAPRNLAFLVILALFALGNSLMHMAALGENPLPGLGSQFGLNLVILVIVVMGGRVIPFFTRNPLPGMQPRQWQPVEIASVAGVLVLALWELLQRDTPAQAALALALGGVHFLRLAGWQDRRLWGHPIIWVLHLGYGAIALGFVLKGLAGLGLVGQSGAVHAFTVGGIGLMTLGMMARVSLGHTGRPLELPRLTVIGIYLLTLGATLRVIAGLGFWSGLQAPLLGASALLWILAFSAFCIDYWPKLIRPRVDGRPG